MKFSKIIYSACALGSVLGLSGYAAMGDFNTSRRQEGAQPSVSGTTSTYQYPQNPNVRGSTSPGINLFGNNVNPGVGAQGYFDFPEDEQTPGRNVAGWVVNAGPGGQRRPLLVAGAADYYYNNKIISDPISTEPSSDSQTGNTNSYPTPFNRGGWAVNLGIGGQRRPVLIAKGAENYYQNNSGQTNSVMLSNQNRAMDGMASRNTFPWGGTYNPTNPDNAVTYQPDNSWGWGYLKAPQQSYNPAEAAPDLLWTTTPAPTVAYSPNYARPTPDGKRLNLDFATPAYSVQNPFPNPQREYLGLNGNTQPDMQSNGRINNNNTSPDSEPLPNNYGF